MRDNRFITEKICVVIPTYNNDKTLVNVINDVPECTDQIIVVNDGSTDGTIDALAFYTDCT